MSIQAVKRTSSLVVTQGKSEETSKTDQIYRMKKETPCDNPGDRRFFAVVIPGSLVLGCYIYYQIIRFFGAIE